MDSGTNLLGQIIQEVEVGRRERIITSARRNNQCAYLLALIHEGQPQSLFYWSSTRGSSLHKCCFFLHLNGDKREFERLPHGLHNSGQDGIRVEYRL